jgi:uncharacterized protein YdaU (DUF1376 family)
MDSFIFSRSPKLNNTQQNRKPPAYQEYAASMMATTEYRVLTLSERGLLYTLRLECWVNGRVPEDPSELAKLLGVNEAELRAALPRVMFFFVNHEKFIYSPELENYREFLSQVREKQSRGGKKGAAKANAQRRKLEEQVRENAPQVPQGLTTGFLDKTRKVKSNSNSVINEEVPEIHKEWIDALDGKT